MAGARELDLPGPQRPAEVGVAHPHTGESADVGAHPQVDLVPRVGEADLGLLRALRFQHLKAAGGVRDNGGKRRRERSS